MGNLRAKGPDLAESPTDPGTLPNNNPTTRATSTDTPETFRDHSVKPRTRILPGVCFGRLHFAGHALGNISSYNGIPFFSEQGKRWIRSCTGRDAVFPDPPGDLVLQDPPPEETSLPSEQVVQECLAFFRNSHLKLEFPLVDPTMFQDTICLAYGQCPGASPSEIHIAKASVFAFLSVISFFEGERPPLVVDGDECALKARHLLSASPQELGITTLQTALMLALHQLFSGQIPFCSIYISLAVRVMFMLGGHTLPDPWTNPGETNAESLAGWRPTEARHLRKLFWLCYTLDKEVSLRTGQPPAISDDHCDLTLPDGYLSMQYLDEWQYADIARLDDSPVPLLPGDLRLTMIKSKACKLLYSAEALRKSDADLLRDIRELDEELERWRLSVPPKHRPVLALSQSAMWTPETPRSIRTVVIHFEYHYLMATIHQATSRCRAWTASESREMDSVRSSLALAVEASRSTVLSLRTAVHSLLEDASWTLIFYPMSAVTTIFCNILWDPLNPRSQQDLALLDAAPEFIRRIRWRRMTESEMQHLRVADDFLAELARLGKHAMDKARQELDMHNHLRLWGA